ncbi:MAG: SPOR domain-containing protein [Bacteroides sp.]|jgi:cell division protein FtsN|nr:SPOR domain-containing protein [Bacteroides sp.]
MKKTTLFILLALVIGATSCKSKRMLPVTERAEPDIPVREERFTFTREADRVSQQNNTFFVIMGSFQSRENADRFSETLRELGFSPSILLSETGFHRASVNSFLSEDNARSRVLQIREEFPDYADTWLLIKKDD